MMLAIAYTLMSTVMGNAGSTDFCTMAKDPSLYEGRSVRTRLNYAYATEGEMLYDADCPREFINVAVAHGVEAEWEDLRRIAHTETAKGPRRMFQAMFTVTYHHDTRNYHQLVIEAVRDVVVTVGEGKPGTPDSSSLPASASSIF